MNPAVLYRLCYAPSVDESEVRWRIGFFRDHVLPRVAQQQCDVWVWVHPRHEAEIRALGVRTFTVDHDSERRHPVTSRHPWLSVRGLPCYQVQLLAGGSDDFVAPDFVSTALTELERVPGRRALVTFQPWKYDLATDRVYAMRRYRADRPSMFLALRQNLADARYHWVYSRGHTKMHAVVDSVRVAPAGKALLVVHRYNDSTTVLDTDVLTERPSWL